MSAPALVPGKSSVRCSGAEASTRHHSARRWPAKSTAPGPLPGPWARRQSGLVARGRCSCWRANMRQYLSQFNRSLLPYPVRLQPRPRQPVAHLRPFSRPHQPRRRFVPIMEGHRWRSWVPSKGVSYVFSSLDEDNLLELRIEPLEVGSGRCIPSQELQVLRRHADRNYRYCPAL